MKAGVILTLHVAGFPVEAAGIFTEDKGIILSGSLKLPSKGSFREVLGDLLKKGGYTLNLSVIPEINIETLWMSYCQGSSEMRVGLKLRDGMEDLGEIQAVMPDGKKKLLLLFSFIKRLEFSKIPAVGDWIGKGSFGPIGFIIDSDGSVKLSLSYSYGDENGKALLVFPLERNKGFSMAEETKNTSAVQWKSLKKSIGCVTLLAAGYAFSEGELWVLLRTELHLGIFSITLEGLGVCIPFTNLRDTYPMMTGLGLGVKTDQIEISGFFAKELNKPSYIGQITIRVRNFSVSLMGVYEQAPYTSVFAIGVLELFTAGTGCVKITKIAAGFGYNRLLFIPQTDRLSQFALMRVLHGDIPVSQAAAEMPASQGQKWLASGVQFESYGMVCGEAAVSVLFGNILRADITGMAVLDLRVGNSKKTGENHGSFVLAHAVLLIQASFQPEAGLIAVTAMLGGESYLLSKKCRITGGFACYIWYEKEHKGDFVVSIGGYHSNYKKPEHYPSVAPLGLKWKITDELLVQGNIYFALTPAALMAGGTMQMLFEAGCVQAWCTASVDMMLQWKPLLYDFRIDISLGVRVKLWFMRMKLEIGCGLHLWGPEFSGIARVNLWIISFDIKFVENDPGSTGKIDWSAFKEAYLKPETVRESDSTSFCGCSIQICEGPQILIQTSLPYTAYRINGGELMIPLYHGAFGIYPCRVEKAEATLLIEIYTVHQDPKENEAVDMSLFCWQPEITQIPCALWGTSEHKDNRGNWKQETFKAASGIAIQVINAGYPELNVPLSRETRSADRGEEIWVPVIEGKKYEQSKVYDKMAEIRSQDVEQKRAQILADLGIDTRECFTDQWTHAEKLQELFREAPYMETLGGGNG